MLKEWKILILISLSIFLSACHKVPPKVTAPLPIPPPRTLPAPLPPPNQLEIGEQKFFAGDFPEAAQWLEAYIAENPTAADIDRAIFRLGMAYTLIAKTPQDMAMAQSRLRMLVSQFPQSAYKPQAELILTLQSDLEQLRRDIQDREKSILALNEKLRGENKKVAERDAGIRDREVKLKERDEKIRKLTQELDQIKKIDLERRPSLPPNKTN